MMSEGEEAAADVVSDKARMLASQVFQGSDENLRQAISKYIKMVASKMLSKAALTEILQATKGTFPKPNIFPDSYAKLKSLLGDELRTLEKIHVCINDCVLLRGQ